MMMKIELDNYQFIKIILELSNFDVFKLDFNRF